jgi:hypothetical protein
VNRTVRLTTLALCALSLVGCATTRYAAQMPDTQNCVADLREIAPLPLQLQPQDTAPVAVEFATIARCVRPAGAAGGVPVALYRLEGITAPAEVNIAVTLSTGGTFAASADLLDEEFRPVQQLGFGQFVRRGTQYSLSAFLNPDAPTPRYLLLKPDPGHVGKSDTVVGSATNPVVIPAGPVIFTYHAGSETNTVRPFLEGGQVMVSARPHLTTLSDQ